MHDLEAEVKELLAAARGHWPAIAPKADVSYSWICKFMAGRFDNPGYRTLCRLRDELRARASQSATTN